MTEGADSYARERAAEARTMAEVAGARITALERYLGDQHNELKALVKGLYDRWWWMMLTLLTALLGLVSTLGWIVLQNQWLVRAS